MLNLNNLEGARGKLCICCCSSIFHFLIPQDVLSLSSLDCIGPASFFVLLMKFTRRTRGMPRESGLGHWDFDGLRSAAVFEQNWILKNAQSCIGSLTSVPSLPQLAGKYDNQKEEELRLWIQDVTGKRIGDCFMESLKDGVLLCEWVDGNAQKCQNCKGPVCRI